MSVSNSSSALSLAGTLVVEEGSDHLLESADSLPYRLVRNLGHGHSGIVEEVLDTRTRAVFARKTIRIHRPRNHEERQRIFDNEVKIIRNLSGHRHIIRVFATYVTRREVGLILQPVADEGDLEDFLNRIREDQEEFGGSREVCASPTQIAIMQQAFGCLASGLAFMHSQKIRHKDIKPRNILIHQGMVIYTDFGYSLDYSQFGDSTTAGKPDFFTRRYSAPEVLDHGSRNSRSDIFSLGCVFIDPLSLLDENVQITAELCYSVNMENIHSHFRDLNLLNPITISTELRKICISMTVLDRKDRESAATIVARIQGKCQGQYFCNDCEIGIPITSPQPIADIHANTHPSISLRASYSDQGCEPQNVSAQEGQAVSDSPHRRSLTQHPFSSRTDPYVRKDVDGIHSSRFNEASRSILDPGYRKVDIPSIPHFFVSGRVFKLLLTRPAKQLGPDMSSHTSTHFRETSFGEAAYSKVRRFVVVGFGRFGESFSICLPIKTHWNRGTLKTSSTAQDHGVVYTRSELPALLDGESISKMAIRVDIHNGEKWSPESRINYRKPYAVEHNVKVLDIGMVTPEDIHILQSNFVKAVTPPVSVRT